MFRVFLGVFLLVIALTCSLMTVVPGSPAEWMVPTLGFGCAIAGLALIGWGALDYRRR